MAKKRRLLKAMRLAAPWHLRGIAREYRITVHQALVLIQMVGHDARAIADGAYRMGWSDVRPSN